MTDFTPAPAPEVARNFSDEAFRRVLAHFPTGVVLVTTPAPGHLAVTIGSFLSLSLRPALVGFTLATGARSLRHLPVGGPFGVTVLTGPQAAVARRFADPARPRGATALDGVDWRPGPLTGAPLLTSGAAWLECRVGERLEVGDHRLVLGPVLGLAGAPARPLLHHRGRLVGAPGES